MRHVRSLFAGFVTVLLLGGCSPMKPEDFQSVEPHFVLEDYFLGTTRAYGLFEDRFGTVRRQFTVTIEGRMEGDELVLEEDFFYRDGERERRVWRIRKQPDGTYRGRADDIVGEAVGIAAGNALNWSYRMDLKVGGGAWRVTFDDWMFLQDDGVMLNRARVGKWGLEIGRVSLAFVRSGAAGGG